MPSIYAPASPIQWNWLTLIGPDAKDFLHRLTTVNLQNLAPGEGSAGCFLTPQGRIRAYFTLWNYRPGEYAFEYDAGGESRWKKELLATIDQYTFAEKFALADVSGSPDPENRLESRWIFPEPGEPSLGVDAGQTLALPDEIRLCHHGETEFGRPWISVWARPARLTQWVETTFPAATTTSFSTLEQWRVLALRPRIDAEITEKTIPLEVGLMDAVSSNKGCYPGQEVIEKILALGSPARRLALIEGHGPVPFTGEKIVNDAIPPVEVGEITSVVRSDAGFSALAFVRKIHAKEGLKVKFSRQGTEASIIRVAPYA